MSSPDQEELEIRKAVLLLAMQQNNMETFRRLAVELKIRGLPDAIRSKAEARRSGDAGATDTGSLEEQPGAAGPTAEELAMQVEVEVHQVMSELAPENLGTLAEELGIPEDELRTLISGLPDNFEQMVADEVKTTLPSNS
jgi:hypothetical protein